MPDDVLDRMRIRERLLESASPLRRVQLKRWIAGKTPRDIIRAVRARGSPRDVAEQQEKIARADALAFIAPIYFV